MPLALTLRGRAGLVLVAAVGSIGCVAVQSARAEHAAVFPDARSLARAAGCASSFAEQPVQAPVYSAGRCTVAGAVVELRTLGSAEAAAAWADGVRSAAAATTASGLPGSGGTLLGDGWVVRSTDGEALSRLTQALPARG